MHVWAIIDKTDQQNRTRVWILRRYKTILYSSLQVLTVLLEVNNICKVWPSKVTEFDDARLRVEKKILRLDVSMTYPEGM